MRTICPSVNSTSVSTPATWGRSVTVATGVTVPRASMATGRRIWRTVASPTVTSNRPPPGPAPPPAGRAGPPGPPAAGKPGPATGALERCTSHQAPAHSRATASTATTAPSHRARRPGGRGPPSGPGTGAAGGAAWGSLGLMGIGYGGEDCAPIVEAQRGVLPAAMRRNVNPLQRPGYRPRGRRQPAGPEPHFAPLRRRSVAPRCAARRGRATVDSLPPSFQEQRHALPPSPCSRRRPSHRRCRRTACPPARGCQVGLAGPRGRLCLREPGPGRAVGIPGPPLGAVPRVRMGPGPAGTRPGGGAAGTRGHLRISAGTRACGAAPPAMIRTDRGAQSAPGRPPCRPSPPP